MIKEAIAKIVGKVDLTREEIETVMEEIMTGTATPSQISAFISLLRMKGETIEEITGCALVMRRHATKIKTNRSPILDTCGTGGDGACTFNISTISAFVAAGAGLVVAKHGNRSVSSQCGSADLLQALGVNIEMEAEKVKECVEKIGIGFLFAPLLHSAMKFATPVRREIGMRTIFNILGPLTNPAGARHQLLGVYDERLTEPLAMVLGNLESQHCLVVHGMDGLDEVTTTTETIISELRNGAVKTYTITPDEFGIKRAKTEDLKGGDQFCNSEITLGILGGKKSGPQRDIVLLNAGCAIYAGDSAGNIKEGIERAADAIDSGSALEKLELLKEYTNK